MEDSSELIGRTALFFPASVRCRAKPNYEAQKEEVILGGFLTCSSEAWLAVEGSCILTASFHSEQAPGCPEGVRGQRELLSRTSPAIH